MLEIKNIKKEYNTEGFKQKALDDVSVNFRKCEFASILGPSGSGKTTFLNIIGGLDHYDSGDLIINEISTKKFKDVDWDSYRNHRIGFVFQSYNLITHQSVLSNVKLALTLSGISKKEATERAKKALKEVGLESHMYKRPNQLSGGQMQRVAIARALVNNPEIILADEPTGALDSETSIQIMKVLKKISKDKLVIMVTHNPELAKEYSTRIINLKDGKIISDSNPYDGSIDTKEETEISKKNKNKTKMKFLTALSLSFNNLMTKKARTILVALAGSIGIIGIALIMSVSTGFQNYVDSIQEETLTSYPLSIMEESGDFISAMLSTGEDGGVTDSNTVVEKQNIASMVSSVSTNDLKSFKKYLEANYDSVKDDLTNVKYSYNISPNIYTIDVTDKLVKLNPSTLFTSLVGESSLLNSFSSYSSIFSEMVENTEEIETQYDVLAGRYPKNYDEAIIVLSNKNEISDLLVYSLGLRDNAELTEMITNVMSGEPNDIHHDPLTFTYEDLMNVDLRVIMPTDLYKYNSKYDIYEDMSANEDYLQDIYDKAMKLKIVGILSPKEGSMNSMALNPGVNYTTALTKYIIDYASKTDIVKKQIENTDRDVFSGNKFTDKKNNFDFDFSDLIEIDKNKLQSAFNINIDESAMRKQTEGYMTEISNAITTDTTPATTLFTNNLNEFANGIFTKMDKSFTLNDIDKIVNGYLETSEVKEKLTNMETTYVIPKDTFKTTYQGLLKALLQAYVAGFTESMKLMNPNYVIDQENPQVMVVEEIKQAVLTSYLSSAAIIGTETKMGSVMTEALMKKTVLTKVGELTSTFTNSLASSFHVDQNKIASAFKLKYTEEELTRIISAMMTSTESTAKSNLTSLGYQDLEEPTRISFYFTSFDGKENFMSFLDNYNNTVDEEKKINYSDTTGILMSSVKTIVNAVSYVLIAFVSISLVVSSIMIGVITYISVYERTKEIGILRAIGASKKNVSSIFNAETFIIGLLSGLLGIGISYMLIPIINSVLHHFTGNIPLSAALEIHRAVILIILSIILTLIGGIIPARAAAKKDPVEALRSE